MRLKKLHLSLLGIICLGCNVASAQLFIDQATFTIQSGATVTVQGDVTSNTDILGTGKVILKGTANQNINLGGFTVPNLEVDNTSNVTLTGSAKISGDLLFTNGDIIAGNNNLTIGSTGTITNAASTKFFVTNGTGRLIKAALASTAFNFPIGNSTTSYDPVSISNSGTSDDIGARSFANVLAGGATGTAYAKETINNSWDISEAVAGGSNLSVTATWNTADELPGFDRNRGGLSNYLTTPAANVGWDLLNSQTGMAVGANPYTYTRTGITTTGIFAVGTRPVLSPLLVSPKIFLQGNYNTGTGVMTDALRSANLIPTTEPYSGLTMQTVALRGSGGGETASSSVIGLAAGVATNTTAVDWVLAQLHRSSDGIVVSQRAVLLLRNGTVVETDGITPVNFAGNAAGSYFVSIRHRNHLGVRSANTLALAKVTSTNYDFTTGLGQAFIGSVTTNTALAPLTPTVFGLWGGDVNGNRRVIMSGGANDLDILLNTVLGGNVTGAINSVYNRADLNLNGRVSYSAGGNDYNILVNVALSGNVGAILNQPIF
jgi:hypothetical protein